MQMHIFRYVSLDFGSNWYEDKIDKASYGYKIRHDKIR